MIFLVLGCLLILCNPALAQHPKLSILGTWVYETEGWDVTRLLELQSMKNLENGDGVGIKIGTDFEHEIEISAALRSMIKSDFFGYFDFGYALDRNEGFICEVGLGKYFMEHQRLGFHVGMKYYADPDFFRMPIGFSINF